MDELMHLLSQLGLGAAARPIYDSVMDLEGEALSSQQLEQAIREILGVHGAVACADAVISALREIAFRGLDAAVTHDSEVKAAGGRENNSIHPSVAANDDANVFTKSRAPGATSLRGWLDIDSGICIDDQQQGADTDSER